MSGLRFTLRSPLFTRAFSSRAVGTAIGLFGVYQLRGRAIANESTPAYVDYNARFQSTVQYKTRLGGKLDYEQLSVGSFTGLLTGYIAGKLSRLIAFITLSGLLTLQFLESRGFITTSALPLVNRIYTWFRDKFDITEFIMDKPSFKLSYFFSFAIAALYA